jgi:two-component system OmpR family sensor kinase
MLKRILFILSGLILGFFGSVLVLVLFDPEPILAFRMGTGVIIFLFGAFVSTLIAAVQWGMKMGRENTFQQADERRRSFIRRLDHEIKNPLTGLRAALANLSEAASPNDREKAAINARRDVERLTRLLADLRKLSDLDERPLEHLPVYIPNILEEIVEATSSLPAYQGRTVGLLINNVPSLPLVTGDRDLLGLAFYNLVENALKFSGPGREVEVRAREEGRGVIVEVADGGSGIPAEDLPYLFEELYRGANARGVEGSGLGLALTARIVDLHGGSLEVASRQGGERQGTVFSIHLPVGRAR